MFKITEELAGQILNYLASKPYIEVAGLINNIQQLEKLDNND